MQDLEIIGKLADISMKTAFALALVGGFRKWWVYGWVHTDLEKKVAEAEARCEKMRQERDVWMERAWAGVDYAKSATSLAEKLRAQ
jgi:hypothetical protein